MAEKTIKILIFDNDEFSGTLIENYLKEVKFPYEIKKYPHYEKSVVKAEGDCYKFIFADLSKQNSHILDDITIQATNNKNIFFMMSSEPTTDLYVKALRAGAKEFLRKPLIKDDFFSAINNNFKSEMISDNKIVKKTSKIIAVTSLEKGCGKTFFAVNTAAELAEVTKDRVLLIDFNENLNNVTFMLDIDQKYDTNYFIQNITEENAKSLFPKLYRYKDSSLYIMSNCMYKAQNMKTIAFDNFSKFLLIAKRFFRFIVIDVNNDLEKTANTVYANTDMIFYMISSGVSANERNQSYIDVNFGKKKFRIVMNKYREKDEAKVNEIENILGREIFYKIPINMSVTLGSNSRGRTVREINPNLDITKCYNNLAKYIISRV